MNYFQRTAVNRVTRRVCCRHERRLTAGDTTDDIREGNCRYSLLKSADQSLSANPLNTGCWGVIYKLTCRLAIR
ncbi:unnamed protein product [Nippostrongylus brasiliensis]|uniref:Bacteriophage protein n=1 Tax=Nippostrongylus brasiliensis TaxID=27835 RepID=A0A0N4Y928_NIPBR|nr:unnamed protein product [Nippostrongylus brasiliensis]